MVKNIFIIVFLFYALNSKAQTWQELIDLTQDNYAKNELQTSLTFSKKALKKAAKEFGKNHENYAVSLNNLAFLYHKLNQYDEAIAMYKESILLTEIKLGQNNSSYALSLYNLARVYESRKDFDNALKYYFNSLQSLKKSLGIQSNEYVSVYQNLMNMYPSIDTYVNKKDFYEKALELTLLNFGEQDQSYNYIIDKLGDIYFEEENYKKALEMYNKGRYFVEKQTQMLTEDYYYFCNKIIATLEIDNQINQAIIEGKNALENSTKNLYENHFYTGVFQNQLARLYILTGDFHLAQSNAENGLKNVLQNFGEEHTEYLNSLINIANVYEKLGIYEKALEKHQKALDLGIKILTEIEVAELYNNLAGAYFYVNEYENSKFNYIEALKILEKNNAQNSASYGNTISNLAFLYQNIGQFNKALDYYLIANKIIIETIGKNNLTYTNHLENMGKLYQFALMFDEAIAYYTEALQIKSTILGKNNPDYALGLTSLSSVYKEKGNFQKALEYINQALKMYEETKNNEQIQYFLVLQNKAVILESLDKQQEAILLYENILDKLNQLNFKNLNQKGIILTNLLNLYHKKNNANKILELLPVVQNIQKNQLLKNFSFLSENEKMELSNSLQQNLNLLKYICFQNKNTLEFSNYIYDIELFTKEIILQSSVQIREKILNSKNETAKEKLEEWLFYKNYLNNEYKKATQNKSEEIISTENYINQLEIELSKSDTIFNKTNSINIATWQEVQKKLRPNEIAIEFSKIVGYNESKNQEQHFYAAIILKHIENPTLVQLFEQKQLDSILSNNSEKKAYINKLYRGSKANDINNKNENIKLYNIIWKPLENYLNDIKKIYFAPTHTLHQIAFSALTDSNEKTVLEKYDLIQLSSTAQLLNLDNSTFKLKEILLFGGMNFNLNNTNNNSNTWQNLPGTLKEVENIYQIFINHSTNSEIFIDQRATEENFKKIINKKQPSIIHLATHGFFFDTIKKEENKDSKTDEVFFKVNENPLFRSGILFSGANANWNTKIINQKKEDGILTAYEVANCNLFNTDLVVLSACETGLGEINGSEGVFGLQRSFKTAGVKNIIMSLWEVPDNETFEFMKYFYEELTKTQNIETSFRATQKFMKNKYTEEPYKWAAFVLIK